MSGRAWEYDEQFWKRLAPNRTFRPDFPQLPRESLERAFLLRTCFGTLVKELMECGTFFVLEPKWRESTPTMRGVDGVTEDIDLQEICGTFVIKLAPNGLGAPQFQVTIGGDPDILVTRNVDGIVTQFPGGGVTIEQTVDFSSATIIITGIASALISVSILTENIVFSTSFAGNDISSTVGPTSGSGSFDISGNVSFCFIG